MQKDKSGLSIRRSQIRLRLGVGLCIAACVLGLYLLHPPLLVQIDRHIYDIFLRRAAGGTPSPTPAIVDLDETSLAEVGQWPWPRHLVADLVHKLTEAGAAAIALDILLAEEDRTSPANLQKTLRDSFDTDVTFSGLPDFLWDNDILLAETLLSTPTVLGMFLQYATPVSRPLPAQLPPADGVVEQVPAGAPPLRSALLRAHGATLPLPTLWSTSAIGSINVLADPDGVVRAVPLVTQLGDRIMPNLALRALMRALQVSTMVLLGGSDGLAAVRVGRYTIPVTPEGLFQVAFRGGRRTYPYFSATDILHNRVPAEELRGRIVFLGTSAPGLLDIRTTPLDSVFPGVEVHAAVLDVILSGNYIQTPPWAPGVQVTLILAACLAVTLTLTFAAPIVYLPLGGILAAGTVWGSWNAFLKGYFFSPQYVVITIAALTVSLLAVRFSQEARQRQQLRTAFTRYVAPSMVDRIADRGDAVLSGEERTVTLMFTDIRNFTSLSERLQPEQVVAVLNRFFTPMTALIHASSGTVDKFIGDAIMAFWNAPLDVPRHEMRAVRCALDMQVALGALNASLEKDLGINLSMGVGVHTGKVYVGNMGTVDLLDYTCIGDTVNLASRLEGLCPVYGVGAVVSGSTVERCRAYPLGPKDPALPCFVHLDDIRVRGKHMPVQIFTPLTPSQYAKRRQELEQFAMARALYAEGRFAAAAGSFSALGKLMPDAKLYRVYADRCTVLLQTPPEKWDGVWTLR